MSGLSKKRLGEVCVLQRGYDLPTHQRKEGIVPLLSSSGVIDSVTKAMIKGPGVVTGRSGSVGNVFYIDRDYWPLNTTLYVKDFHGNNERYIYYLLSSLDLEKLGGGVGVPTLNRNVVHEELVNVSPVAEQQRIVGKLDAAFAALTEAQAHVERNRANARELFESYLNGVFEGKGDGWVEKRLDEICDVRDGTHASPKYHTTGYALVTSKNLKPDGLELENVSLINEDDFNEINRRSKVDKGDVLFAMIGTIGNPTVIEDEPNFAIKNVALFKCGAMLDGRFLRYALLTTDVKERMRKEAKGTTQRFVGLGYLRSFRVAVPNLREQQRIVAELDALNEKTRDLETTYQQKLTELAGLKKAVLGAAFAGKL